MGCKEYEKEYRIEKIFSEGLLEFVRVEFKDLRFHGIKFEMAKAPLIVMEEESSKLVVGCGYLSIETMEKLEVPSCIVTGVKSFEDILSAEIKLLTSKAKDMGLKEGIGVMDALNILNSKTSSD